MIVAVKASDAIRLAALHRRAFDRPWSADDIARMLENPTTFALLSHAGPEQGFVIAWAAAGEAEILTVAVVPEARRKGVATTLVNAAGVAALVRGAAVMHLEVAEDNTPARALYAKLGYQEVGVRPAYYPGSGAGVDAIVMRRTLPRPVV
jgi:ribosomal-protein-alanine N-acetyltransferase